MANNSIPVSKVARAAKIMQTGVNIGGNYLKYYAKKAINSDLNKDQLHQDNADDIYNSLSKLKGSALKMAQMISMDKNILPKAYSNKFALSQYSVPPMSAPLVIKTFRSSTGKSPREIFDTFDEIASNAASIGQVHKATKDGKTFAVKIQYPGVAESIISDLKLVKPVAARMFGLKQKDLQTYFTEVEQKMLEETDYELELKQGNEAGTRCAHFTDIRFPHYYKEFSNNRILTMDWMEGLHLKEFLATNPTSEIKNKVAQSMWDLYQFQLHEMFAIHADPHPGNFLITPDGSLGIIDFGCVKEVPKSFYFDYFPLLLSEIQENQKIVDEILILVDVISTQDSIETKKNITKAFMAMTKLLSAPFRNDTFHFTMDYLQEIYKVGDEIYQLPEVKNGGQSRGSRHTLYINRTFFGLYTLLADLDAKITTTPGKWKQKLLDHWKV